MAGKIRKWLSLFAGLLFSTSASAHVSAVPFPEIGTLTDAHKAAFAIFQTALPPQIICNLVTGVASVGGPCTSGATCNGVADTAPAFWAFRTWALANQGATNQVVLSIPAGSDCLFDTNAGTVGGPLAGVQNTFIAGIHNLIVDGGAGATLRQGAAGYWLANFGVCQAGLTSASGCSARIQTASASASTVTLTSASLAAGYVSRFSVGDWIMVGGLDVQGNWNYACGFPPNQSYFEWRQITGKNAGTGALTLDRPLTNSYLDTWPNYNSGAPPGTSPTTACSNGEADNGGAATIWKVGFAGAEWNATVEFRGLTLTHPSNPLYSQMRSITYRNVVFNGGGLGGIPSQNETFTAINTTWPSGGLVEVDKLVGTISLDTVTADQWHFQSNSIDQLTARNTTFTTSLLGNAKRTDFTDVTIGEWRVGSYSYGNTAGPVSCLRCKVTTWSNAGVLQDDASAPYSMSGGVISFANTAATGGGPAQRWASTIGKDVFFGTNGPSGQYSSLGVFRVVALTQDATNTYVQTNQAGGFPPLTNYGAGYMQFRANGAQQFTNDNPDSASDPAFKAMSTQNGATPLAPMMTYSKRSFTPSAAGILGLVYGIGKLVSLTIDVTVASTHTGAITVTPTAPFSYNAVKQSNWTTESFFPTINLKQTGVRVITPSGVTCNGSPGGCSGDSITQPTEAIWLWNALQPNATGTYSGGVNPQFTMTIQTDQTP